MKKITSNFKAKPGKSRKMGRREKVARGVVVDSHKGIGSHGRPRGAYGTNQQPSKRYAN